MKIAKWSVFCCLFTANTTIITHKAYSINCRNKISSSMVVNALDGEVFFENNHNIKGRIAPFALMAFYIALEQIENGNLHLDEKIKLDNYKDVQLAYGFQATPIAEKSVMTLEDLLFQILNNREDALVILSRVVAGSTSNFFDIMNATAKEMEMENTFFAIKDSLPEKMQSYSTVYDIAKLAIRLKYKFLKQSKKHLLNTSQYLSTDGVMRERSAGLYNIRGLSGSWRGENVAVAWGNYKQTETFLAATGKMKDEDIEGCLSKLIAYSNKGDFSKQVEEGEMKKDNFLIDFLNDKEVESMYNQLNSKEVPKQRGGGVAVSGE
jgi:hypothetical protein